MLLGNYSVYLKSPNRWLGGNATAGNAHAKARPNFQTPGQFRSGTMRDGGGDAGTSTAQKLLSIPGGYGVNGWRIPTTAGGISSTNNALITLGASGTGEKGVPITGTSSITLGASGTGGLIVTASGSASLTLGASGALFASLLASGSAGITLSATGAIAATGKIFGNAPLTLGVGASTITGIGTIAGSTEDSGVLTGDSIASAVWSAAASAHNIVGSMGEKLNDAGSASNPWTEVIESGYTAADILRLIAAATQGDASGLESGAPVFKGLDGATERITATYVDGVRTVTTRDGS